MIKALTICQPYAHLIVAGTKDVENRTWVCHHRGLLLIHAGKSRLWLNDRRYVHPDGTPEPNPRDMSFGALVGAAEVVGCVSPKVSGSPWANGPWCIQLERRVRFATPIPFKGTWGLFDVPRNLVDAALTQAGIPF